MSSQKPSLCGRKCELTGVDGATDSASLAAFDRTVTDDREMSTVGPKGTLNYDGPIAAELSDLVTGRVAGRESADERNALIFSGTGIADLASAIAVYEVAIARGIGTRLPL